VILKHFFCYKNLRTSFLEKQCVSIKSSIELVKYCILLLLAVWYFQVPFNKDSLSTESLLLIVQDNLSTLSGL